MAERPPKDSLAPPTGTPVATSDLTTGPGRGAAPASDAPLPVELFQDRYEMGPVLGRGGTCTVTRAWDTRLHRFVAIKRLLPPLSEDPHARTRFNREGRAIARLSHPNLVTLIDRGSTEAEEYLVFEYVEGRSLKEVVRSTGTLEPNAACQIAGQVAEGLAQAHLAGIVHRDVKPQNILLDGEGRAKLTDFGIATGPDWTKVTRAGTIVGSSRYMSPEQVQSRPVDLRTDIYSLGIVLYEMLTGSPPFDGSNIAEIGRQHVRDRPRPLSESKPEIAEDLEMVVLRCLEKLPENRFQSMDEFLGALVGLGVYSLERPPGGLLDGLRRRAHELVEQATDPGARIPSRGSEAPPDGAGSGRVDAPRGRPASHADIMGQRRARGRRRGRRRSYRVALGAILALGGVAVAVLVWLLSFYASPLAPDLVGKPLDQANALATEAKLRVEVSSDQLPSFDSPDVVHSQVPLPGVEPDDGVVLVTMTRSPVAVEASSLDDSDPEGDGREQPDLLGQLTDEKPETSWSTELYHSAAFGNLKQGVGVVFELKEKAAFVRVNSPGEGWKGELQVRAEDGTFASVAELTGAEEQLITLDKPVIAGRVWITGLVPAEKKNYFRVQLSELTFYR